MKKLIALLLSLSLVLCLPMMAMAQATSVDDTIKALEAVLGEEEAEATEAPTGEEAAEETGAPVEAGPTAEPRDIGAPSGAGDDAVQFLMTLGFAMSDSDASEEDQQMMTSLGDFISTLSLKVVSSSYEDGMVFATVELLAGEDSLGLLDIASDGENLLLRGSMLPDGWLGLTPEDLADLTEDMDSSFSINGATATEETQANILNTVVTLMAAINSEAEAWVSAHPDMYEEIAIGSYDVDGMETDAYTGGVRITFAPEMFSTIYGNINTQMEQLAQAGSLHDFDGTLITDYEESMVGQLLTGMVEGYNEAMLGGTVDVLTDDEEGVPYMAVDFTSETNEDFVMTAQLGRKTAETGAKAWNGSYVIGEPGDSEINGTLSASDSAESAELRSLRGAMTMDVLDSAAGEQYKDASITMQGGIDVNETEDLPFNMDFDMHLKGEEADDKMDMNVQFGIKADYAAEAGNSDDMQMNILFKMNGTDDYGDAVNFDMDLGMRLTQLSDGLEWPSMDKVTFISDLDEEAQNAYSQQLQTTLMSWVFGLMSKLPPELMQTLYGM